MQTTSTASIGNASRPPKPRTPGIPLDGSIPRHWFAGNVWATQVANGVNLLFPAGERFFVRSVNHFLKDIDDPLLLAQVRGFFGQEGRHAKEHERFFAVLAEQGYDVARFLRLYEAIAYGLIERVSSPRLRLATTAACEHFTAILAEQALRERVLDHAHPTVQRLLLWHAAEEIEHRSVAFDVLETVAPSYPLRMAGLFMATACLGGFWVIATTMLLAQEKGLTLGRIRRDGKVAHQRLGSKSVFRRGILEYMRRDFHPSQADIDGLASEYLESVGLT
jgi:uncharacterized protein